jgi:hypothetical protein
MARFGTFCALKTLIFASGVPVAKASADEGAQAVWRFAPLLEARTSAFGGARETRRF